MIKHYLIFIYIIFSFAILSKVSPATAQESEPNSSSYSQIIETDIREQHEFFGLAAYYNNVEYYIVSPKKLSKVKESSKYQLSADEVFVAVGRFNTYITRAPEGIYVEILNDTPKWSLGNIDSYSRIVSKDKLKDEDPNLDRLRYIHLWGPLALLTKGIDAVIVFIHQHVIANWTIVVIILSILIKIFLTPLSILTTRYQGRVSEVQSKLLPKLAKIKKELTGEEAHHAFMDAHKTLGVTPYYSLKPLIPTLIQIPILIAVFNALAEMPQFKAQSFLWINDLSLPDAIFNIGVKIPLFGSALNLMPFLMTIVTVISTILFQNRKASAEALRKQKLNLYLMAIGFFILFYPFPSVMVMYWTCLLYTSPSPRDRG